MCEVRPGYCRFQDLRGLVERWMSSSNRLHRSGYFQLFAQPTPTQRSFTIDLLLYLVVRTFPTLLPGLPSSALVDLSGAVKRGYGGLLLRGAGHGHCGGWFQVLVLLHVRLVSHFVADWQDGLRVEHSLESEFCVAIYHALLGVEVAHKTYQLLQRRHKGLRKRQPSRKQSIEHPSMGRVSAISTELRMTKFASSARIPRTQKNIGYSRQSGSGTGSKQIQKVQRIESVLQQNLRVQPLPKLQHKKLTIRQFERVMTECVSVDEWPTSQVSVGVPPCPKSRHIYSNQLSSALKGSYAGSLLFELNSKGVRLGQTVQNFQRERRMQVRWEGTGSGKENAGTQQPPFQQETVATKRMHTEDWGELVRGLKRKVFRLPQEEASGKEKPRPKQVLDRSGCFEGRKDRLHLANRVNTDYV